MLISRDKSSGWGLNVKIKTKTKTKTRSCVIDPYYYHFLKGDTYRECCYRCSYSRPERVGDVTIGDFWGIESILPDFFSKKGVSCLILNTPNVMALIPMFKSLFDMEEVSLNDVMKFQRNLVAPTPRPDMRDIIYKRLDEKDLESFFKTVLTYPLNVKSELIAILPEWMKKVLRKMLSAVMR
ncbi:Coenzyme F420 hydrogenase/dehydrogenase, beta subunit C-terminal domain [Bacteroides ovatus]|uniref:Coenzyme F420 hydrogenase/dehydrogenase, beta subunit C-terminal domain n=1 Tax=Bacteroides ovatus TaxID=28116 RepID=UPI00232EF54D|nr:Coenzyme F420 hydrogenase/dehydrogenase, beta subunit C-terminal domain [Bacteroides ovatus]MDC2617431.1 Coenzyme F420 hydrogenase/dehydrogenase, beta subunit C-terminal domain [Bacteroides ovatus]